MVSSNGNMDDEGSSFLPEEKNRAKLVHFNNDKKANERYTSTY